jgi:replicative DNA helicase
MSEKEHSKTVLAAILPNRKDLLEYAMVRLTPDHFEPPYKNIFYMLDKYFQVAKGILTRQGVEDILRRTGVTDFGVIAVYLEHYDALVAQEVSEEDFRWSVDELNELLAKRETEEALLEGINIIKNGVQTTKGKELKGHTDARATILEKFASIELKYQTQETPDGDIKDEKDEILKEYETLKAMRALGGSQGIKWGVPSLDEITGGSQPGELVLVVGYSSSGKSSFCVQAAWHGAIMQGKNMVFVTSETLRPQIRRKIVARHSKLPMFNYPQGLDTNDMKFGRLTDEEERVLRDVVEDLAYNSSYGKLELVQIPRGSSILTFENTLNRYQDQYQVDGCVMDYLALLRAARKRNAVHEEMSDTMKEAKNIAATFDNGRGIPLISPWQVTRAQKELADKLGYYTTLALSDTKESTNSADVIVAFLESGQQTRYSKLSGAIIKNRDGAQSGVLEIDVDYATSHFTDASVNAPVSIMSDSIDFLGLN